MEVSWKILSFPLPDILMFSLSIFSLFFPTTSLLLSSLLFSAAFPYFPTSPATHRVSAVPSDPGAVVETHSAVPYAVIGGVLALLVFTVICVLIVTIWCSVRQKGKHSLMLSPVASWHSEAFVTLSTGIFSNFPTSGSAPREKSQTRARSESDSLEIILQSEA